MDVFLPCHDDEAKRTSTLDAAYRLESKTRQFPFVIASDIDVTAGLAKPVESVVVEPLSYMDLLMGTTPKAPEKSRTPSPEIQKQIITESDFNKAYYEILAGKNTASNKLTTDNKLTQSKDCDNALEDSESENKEEARREFFVFHDIEHFIQQRDNFPYCHEVIRCPSKMEFIGEIKQKIYNDELCKGRLIFDFDLEEPLPNMSPQMYPIDNQPLGGQRFVPSNFKILIEFLIMKTFSKYYLNVDSAKLIFVWQITKHPNKFSMHLIVKHAYFSEYWVKQMRVFYYLMMRVAYKNNMGHLMKTVDFQIPRRNATFRMIGSCKVGGLPLELDSCHCNGIDLLAQPGFQLTIYDCLAGIYHSEYLKTEQHITMDNINYSKIDSELTKIDNALNQHNRQFNQTQNNTKKMTLSGDSFRSSRDNNNSQLSKSKTGLNKSKSDSDIPLDEESILRDRKFKSVVSKNLSLTDDSKSKIDLDNADIEKAIKIFESWNESVGSFGVRDQVGDIINLNRTRRAACPISGNIHDHENAYLKLKEDGHLLFVCRRGCKHKSEAGYETFGLDLGVYKSHKREKGIIPINPSKLIIPANTVVDLHEFEPLPPPKPIPEHRSGGKLKTSAKLAPIGSIVVQIPSFMRNNREQVLMIFK